jgi:hypothetical protein
MSNQRPVRRGGAKPKGRFRVRRIILVLAVAATMAAMLAVMAVPAFAEIACTWEEDYWTGEQTFVCYDYGYDDYGY